jgi:hypothetical protein
MQNKTITNALIALRKQMIRDNLDGLAHVDALLAARGVDPATVRFGQRRKPDHARQGIMRLMVKQALRGGPRLARDIATEIAAQRPEITREAAQMRTAKALDGMRLAGMVKREGRLWGLAAARLTFRSSVGQ